MAPGLINGTTDTNGHAFDKDALAVALSAITDIPEPPSQEFQRMVSSQPFKSSDPYIRKVAAQQRAKLRQIQAAGDDDVLRSALLKQYLTCSPNSRINVVLPFYCEYGFNTRVGHGVFFNMGCTILDISQVTIGSRTLFGPNVQIYTAEHAIRSEERVEFNCQGRPIVIGDDCWIGGAAIILPGITIGNGSTVGAGSVVTKDVPPRSVVAGNPARVIKTLD